MKSAVPSEPNSMRSVPTLRMHCSNRGNVLLPLKRRAVPALVGHDHPLGQMLLEGEEMGERYVQALQRDGNGGGAAIWTG